MRTPPPAISSLVFAAFLITAASVHAAPPWPENGDANATLAEYFRNAVDNISQQSDPRQFTTKESWMKHRDALNEQLADMLGLVPEPPRSDLNAKIVGTIERDGIIVQRLHFQSVPGLYVTANLYRPVEVEQPLPAILYVCGHSRQIEKVEGRDVSYGNKTGYQRHGAWFARHGYVCLTIDTIQWGEFLGTHWGTYREGRWDWFSNGYTPAGVEAWNGIRAIDYLTSLPEVDANRIGLTGRSGGGAYSWFTAALDERVKVVVPVAGITDLENHVVDGCVSGHCDCMYFVNYHQWDYPTLAAMIAPRPLLLANSDSDGIFPLNGVLRTAQKVKHVYELLDAKESFGLLITPGPHKDTPELQVGAFRWFDRHLKGLDVPVDEAATESFDRKELQVFQSLPSDERVTEADAVFTERLQNSIGVTKNDRANVLEQVRKQSLSGWPKSAPELEPKKLWSNKLASGSAQLWEFTSQGPWRPQALVVRSDSFSAKDQPVVVHLVDDDAWQTAVQQATAANKPPSGKAPESERLTGKGMTVYITVRGVGPLAWTGSDLEKMHIKRRFYLIGQTLEGMQIWDTLRGIAFAKSLVDAASPRIQLTFESSMQGVAAYATALGEDVSVESSAKPSADHLRATPLLGQGRIEGLESLFE